MKIIICFTILFAIGSASAGIPDACNLPKDSGPCRAAHLRYYFDNKTSECKPFFYGGCDGNGNNFEYLLSCMETCQPETAPKVEDRSQADIIADICSQPSERGPCRAAHPRFYFNKQAGRCEGFLYGGCDGNENNFRTESQCNDACSIAVPAASRVLGDGLPPFPCDEPKKVGPCRAALPRFFFNADSKKCEPFFYGGCFGNGNNFKRLTDCQDLCDMNSLIHPEPAVAAVRSVSAAAEHGADVCSQPKDQGPCRGAHPRFFFNKETSQCEEFLFGGCDGNGNNFKFLLDCMQTCQPKTAPQVQDRSTIFVDVEQRQQPEVRVIDVPIPDDDVCSMAAETGPCFAYFPRYFHNKQTGKCEEFIFGGCHGNGNNFKSVEECDVVCGNQVQQRQQEEEEKKDPAVVCALPSDDGGCRAAFPMYYFNQGSNSCEEFIYGGCKGNDNRFHTREECDQFCKPVMQ